MKNKKNLHRTPAPSAFTLFEVMIALAVFVLAALGVAEAISGAIDAAIEARNRAMVRTQLESRLALCQADPPRPGAPRILKTPGGIRLTETLAPFEGKDSKGRSLAGLYRLTITSEAGHAENPDKVSLLIYHPQPFAGQATP